MGPDQNDAGTPGDAPPPVGDGPGRADGGPVTGRRAGRGGVPGWRAWWEFNRENIVGIRHLLHRNATVTGTPTRTRPDPFGPRRAEVRQTLREIAADTQEATRVRGTALIALGRMGTDREAKLFLGILGNPKESREVRRAAALSLGILRKSQDEARQANLRKELDRVLTASPRLPRLARSVAMLAAGLHAHSESRAPLVLAERALRDTRSIEEASALLFASGLARHSLVAPEVLEAARSGKLGDVPLGDIGRSHAVLALGYFGGGPAAETVAGLLASRRTGIHTKRSAALALGRMLREGSVPADQMKGVEKALRKVLRKSGDVALRGFAAVALGGAEPPLAVRELKLEMSKGNVELRPFAALALGLAARGGEGDSARKIRKLLHTEYVRSRSQDVRAALGVALGLAGAAEALDDLVEVVQSEKAPTRVRSGAANGLGLLGRTTPGAREALLKALQTGPSELIGETALALGMLGARSSVPLLLKMMPKAGSEMARGRVLRALGFLGHADAVEPLLASLKNRESGSFLRMDCCIALGLMGDDRETDPLLGMAAHFNYKAATEATFLILYYS